MSLQCVNRWIALLRSSILCNVQYCHVLCFAFDEWCSKGGHFFLVHLDEVVETKVGTVAIRVNSSVMILHLSCMPVCHLMSVSDHPCSPSWLSNRGSIEVAVPLLKTISYCLNCSFGSMYPVWMNRQITSEFAAMASSMVLRLHSLNASEKSSFTTTLPVGR